MPMYDYECPKCKTKFDIRVPLDKLDERIKCIKPKCKGTLKRLMSTPTFSITV